MSDPGHKAQLRPFQDTIHPCLATCGHRSHRSHHLEAAGTWTLSWEGRHHGRRHDRRRPSTRHSPCRPHHRICISSPGTRRTCLRPCGRTTSLTNSSLKVQACLFSRSSRLRKHTKIWIRTSCSSNKCITKDSSKGSHTTHQRCMGNSTNSSKDSMASQTANIEALCSSTRPTLRRQVLQHSQGLTAGSNQEAKVQAATHGLLTSMDFRRAKVQTRGVREALVGPRCRAR